MQMPSSCLRCVCSTWHYTSYLYHTLTLRARFCYYVQKRLGLGRATWCDCSPRGNTPLVVTYSGRLLVIQGESVHMSYLIHTHMVIEGARYYAQCMIEMTDITDKFGRARATCYRQQTVRHQA